MQFFQTIHASDCLLLHDFFSDAQGVWKRSQLQLIYVSMPHKDMHLDAVDSSL